MNDCRNPLMNYKDGRFCETHMHMVSICGIIPCGREVHTPGALTCDDEAHKNWYEQWKARFTRLSYSSVRRVIRQQRRVTNEAGDHPQENAAPQLRVHLTALGEIAGEDVAHTFRAGSIYCLQTVQWACGMPIGWGKCYSSESAPQVLAILNRIWRDHEDLRPSFIGYDDACDLLRHIVTQNPNDLWIKTTRLVVDAWHYIGHRTTDELCRRWCNPAPTNGSQPDLVVAQDDAAGTSHQTRAFNTETAEQLNAWLNGYEALLRQMTDVNYDFFVHVLFLLFAEQIEDRIEKRERQLDADFFDPMAAAI